MLKRYAVVMAPSDYNDSDSPYGAVWVEYYSAEDFGHAEEQAKDSNPENTTIISVTRDPNSYKYELPIFAACVGRVNNEDYTDLLNRLMDEMTASEKAYFRDLYCYLTFGSKPTKCPL